MKDDTPVQVFRYLPELDAFLCTDEYTALARKLRIDEWTPVVWIGRLFTMNEDFGEHWFDNWEEREAVEEKASALGICSQSLLIVAPFRHTGHSDGPCYSEDVQRRFWTDVLKSLTIRPSTMRAVARDKELSERDDLEAEVTEMVGPKVMPWD